MPLPDPSSPLADRVVLVTGVTAGIGRATARRLQTRSATVIGCARDEARLRALAANLPGLHVVSCDVTDRDARARLVADVLDRHGRLDVLVNNAGVAPIGQLVQLSAADVERVYATNVTAVADLTRLALPGMLGQGRGDIVMISSIAAWASMPPVTLYCSSKFGLDGLVEGLRRETRGSGVRIHSIHPAPVATEWFSRAGDYSPGEGDPLGRPSVGVPASWVAASVERALLAGRARTRSVPRVAGITRLATLPAVGAGLDGAIGRLAPRLTACLRRAVAARTPAPSS